MRRPPPPDDEPPKKEENPFAEFGTPEEQIHGDTAMLMASFPEMEAKKKPSKKQQEEAAAFEAAEEDAGDPLLNSGESDDWAASDSFREIRREMTKRHKSQQPKKKGSGASTHSAADRDASGDEDFLLDEEREDEGWRPSDSQKLAPLRELQGLGAHDEDQFAEEEEEGLGTRVLAREADDMERDEVDEMFFSDIDLSADEYAEASRSEGPPTDTTVRVVRRLEDTQFIDVEELGDVEALLAEAAGRSEDLDEVDTPLPPAGGTPDLFDEGATEAVSLTDADFARAIHKVPSRRLSRIIENVTGPKAVPADQVSREEFDTIFGPEEEA